MPQKEYDTFSESGLEPVVVCTDNGDGTFTGAGVGNPLAIRNIPATARTLAVPMASATGVTATLAVDSVRDTRFITLEAGEAASINAGDVIELFNTVTFMQATVLGKVGDVVELDTLINHTYLAGSLLNVSEVNMTVDGSTTPRIFTIKPEPGQRGRFTRIIISMIATADMDTGTFGPLAALPRGVSLRIKQADGDYRNLYTVKTNAGFKAYSYDGDFDANNANNQRMFTTRLTWGGDDKHDAVIELDGDAEGADRELQMVVQDNLDAVAFVNFAAIVEGSEF